MARPLRIEYAGALYHITARGNAQQNIYFSDDDRKFFLDELARVCERYQWLCHAYCLMSNHYHLLIETCTPTLSKGRKRGQIYFLADERVLDTKRGQIYFLSEGDQLWMKYNNSNV